MSQSSAALAAGSRLLSGLVPTRGQSPRASSPHSSALGSKVGLHPLLGGPALDTRARTPGLALSGLPLGNESLVFRFHTTQHPENRHQKVFQMCRVRNKLVVGKQRLRDEGFSFLVQAQQFFTRTKHLKAFLEARKPSSSKQ